MQYLGMKGDHFIVGFFNFVNKEDTKRAIKKLNGYVYDNLILRVEWTTPCCPLLLMKVYQIVI